MKRPAHVRIYIWKATTKMTVADLNTAELIAELTVYHPTTKGNDLAQIGSETSAYARLVWEAISVSAIWSADEVHVRLAERDAVAEAIATASYIAGKNVALV